MIKLVMAKALKTETEIEELRQLLASFLKLGLSPLKDLFNKLDENGDGYLTKN